MGHARDTLYAARSQDDLVALLAAQPLAWLVSAGGDDAASTPLPLRVGFDADGRLDSLLGHFSKRNPHAARLQSDPVAQVLVMGPHAYVSPSWLDDRTQAPTWNYASASFDVRVSLLTDADAIATELDALVTQMETGRDNAWRMQEMGERQARLAQGVIALRAEIVSVHVTFKLGQDERRYDFDQIVRGLEKQGEAELVRWMRDFDARATEGGR
ncbi:FMN-binding negative transcriptional regulator [Pseudoxanthomonas sp. CF125]|uniref:FMN-binding negative transcriptional regulator n=1 Tax=Pseudoxanthomonas sp. CF125 TaxID=1855303 RepID=UPI00087F00D8|nr:FMN-binding negative transcriptional regulator [Pseudoxanthomonas sp. CF125]SDR14500.1 negative transcriptional regulator, PaiB family [Pseudoxanthomonas sp. CF125]